ncbi:MAG: DnaA/Hda family protein, partial [Victivallaceae bacterium]
LLQAAAHAAQTMEQPLRVRYTSCSELLDSFYDLLAQKRSLGEFRSSLRDIDLLLVDDVHMLANKPQIQEEFFNLFNTLSHQQKQIILTSDKQPCEIKGLEARLVTRFESGVTAEIGVPEVEGRLAILRMMREDTLIKVKLGDPILEFLAQQISSSVRRLKGAFMRLASYASMRGNTPLTVEQAETLLAVQLSQESASKSISIDTIQRLVAAQFGLSVADILGSKRPKNIAEPRMAAMYLCRRLTSHSLPEIGAAFGKTHATIINAVAKVPELCDRDEPFRRTVQKIEQQLKRG